MKLLINILPLPAEQPSSSRAAIEPIASFALPVDSKTAFGTIWRKIERRFYENYAAGRARDYVLKKLQDGTGCDIDLRDTAAELFGDETDPAKRLVQVVRMSRDRETSLPVDSHLHLPSSAPVSHKRKVRRHTEPIGISKRRKLQDTSLDFEEEKSHEGPCRLASPELGEPITDGQSVMSEASSAKHDPEDGTVPDGDEGARNVSMSNVKFPAELTPPVVAGHQNEENVQLEDLPPLDRADNKNGIIVSPYGTRDHAHDQNTGMETVIPSSQAGMSWTPAETELLVSSLADGMDHEAIQERHLPYRSINAIKKRANKLKDEISKLRSKKKGKQVEVRVEVGPAQAVNGIVQTSVNTNHLWSTADDAKFVQAVRRGRDAHTLHDMYYNDRPLQLVMRRMSETRQRLEDANNKARAEQRHKEQVDAGKPSSQPGEDFKQEEDDYLLAALMEGAEIKRVADWRFPLRDPEEVKRQALKLSKKANKKANKKAEKRRRSLADAFVPNTPAEESPCSSSQPPSLFLSQDSIQSILVSLKPEKLERITTLRHVVRQDMQKFNDDRTVEQSEKARSQQVAEKNRAEASDRRERLRAQSVRLEAEEAQKAAEADVADRRLQEDLRNEHTYNVRYSEWQCQARVNTEAGRPAPAPPERPQGSAIGTEIAIHDELVKNRSSRDRTSTSGPATTSSRRSVSFNPAVAEYNERAQPSSPTEARKKAPTSILRRTSPQVVISSQFRQPPRASGQPPRFSGILAEDLIEDIEDIEADAEYGSLVTKPVMSSPLPALEFKSSQPLTTYSARRIRQTRPSFPSQGSQSAKIKKQTPRSSQIAPKPSRKRKASQKRKAAGRPSQQPTDIASDNETSYTDSDLDDDTLSEFAQRSSEERALRSSDEFDNVADAEGARRAMEASRASGVVHRQVDALPAEAANQADEQEGTEEDLGDNEDTGIDWETHREFVESLQSQRQSLQFRKQEREEEQDVEDIEVYRSGPEGPEERYGPGSDASDLDQEEAAWYAFRRGEYVDTKLYPHVLDDDYFKPLPPPPPGNQAQAIMQDA